MRPGWNDCGSFCIFMTLLLVAAPKLCVLLSLRQTSADVLWEPGWAGAPGAGVGQVPWLSLLPCPGKCPVALPQPHLAAQVAHNTVLMCTVTRQKRKTSQNNVICGVFFSFAQWIFPVLVVSELCRGFIKRWSLIVRARSSFTLLWGKSSVLWAWEDLNFINAGTKFCCLHISLFGELSWPCHVYILLNNHMFDLNISIFACPLNVISYCLSAFGYLSINASKRADSAGSVTLIQMGAQRGNTHGSAAHPTQF